ncbi:MAG: TonB family protein [Terriglobales bacterium]
MPVTQIPSRDPSSSSPAPAEHRDLFEAQHWETAYRGFNPEDVPHLLIQLQDDLSRARKREAIWLSIILHLFIVILLWNSEKLVALLPHRTIPLELRADVDRDKDATFLELPPDEQKLARRPDTKILSDKDRIATSKAPQINREELRKLLQSTRPGTPGPSGQPTPPAPSAQNQVSPQQQAPPQQNQQPGSGFVQPQSSDQTAQLRLPPQGNRPVPNFNNTVTAGSAIEQAAQAAAANRGRYGHGEAGDYGFPQGRSGAKALDQAEILTDTMGVDFGPYLTRVVQVVKANWYNLMPPSVYPPILKQGKLSIEFVIQKNGNVSGMTLHTSSGDVPLDRAAWASITASNPFPPLPKEFPGQILGLRFYYFYNLQPDDLK